MSNVPTNLIPTRITGLPEYVGSSTLGYIPYVLEGRTYKVQFANIAAVGAVPSTRVIATGNGLEGGGDLSQNRTISIIPHGVGYSQLDFTGVTAGVYGAADTIPSITVDETGRITNIADVPVVLSNYVPSSRTVTAGAGLTGGGQLNNNITIALNPSNATPQSLGVASAGTGTQAARDDHVHPAVDLTDTSETQGVLPLGRGGTGVALSPVVGAVIYADNDSLNQTIAGNAGQVLTSAGGLGAPYWQTITGTGTVTSVSVVTANGFAGTVANPDTTAAITVKTTVTGMVKGDGTAISAAAAGTDYVAPGAITGSGLTMATSRLLGRTTAGSGAVEEITVGTGLSLSGGSLVNSAPDQVVTLTGAGTTVVTGTYPNFTITSNDQYTGTVTSVAASGGTTGLSFTGSPITTSGTLTLGGTLVVANGGTGATTAAGARTNLGAAASGANSDITSLSGITGGIATPDYIDFDTTATVARATGRLWWDSADGIQTLNLGMAGSNATLQVGEEMYFRIKASSAITEGQVVMFTGSVGNSGALTGAPATGLTKDTASYIMGVATEDIALNGWGYVTQFGLVRNINTTGGAEAWVDGQILYYNPAVAGGLTKNVPSAPNAKVEVAAVVNAASNGSLFVRPIARFSLGQLNDVETSAAANGDLIQYNSGAGYWQHSAPSTITVGTATNLAGGAANRIAYQTGSGTTGFITAPSVANTFLEWSGSAFQWSSNPLGTVTSVDVSGGTTGLTFSGGPVTTSGTITMAGTLAVGNGGTGATSLTSGYLIKGNGTSAVSSSIIYDSGTNVGIGIVPSTKLDVAGPIWSRPGGAVGAVASLTADASSGTNGITLSASYVSGGYGPIKLQTSDTERMRIDSSGNVGVGMTPGVKFDVYGLARFMQTAAPTTGAIVLRSSTSDTYPAYIQWVNNANSVERGFMVIDGSNNFTIQASGSASQFNIGGVGGTHVFAYNESGGEIQLADSTGAGSILLDNSSGLARLLKVGSGNMTVGTTSSGFLRLQTADTERMRVDGSGNVSIGNSFGNARLRIVAGANVNAPTLGSVTNYPVFISNTDASYGLGIGVNASDGHVWLQGQRADGNAGGIYNITLNEAGGNVGIGTSSPVGSSGYGWLTVNGSNSAMSFSRSNTEHFRVQVVSDATYLNNIANTPMLFQTNNTERMRIGSNGSVAIGGSGTDASLHIQQAYGGYNRLTQMAPSGTSNNAFNLMAAKNSGGSDNWWSWGVRTDAVWCLVPGVDSALTSSTGIYFDSSAQAYKPGGGSWQATSDARVKTNIAPITDAASRIMALKPSSFDYRAPEAHAGRTSDRGFIAQEFEEVYPHSVSSIGLMCDEEKVFFAEGEEMKTLGLNNDFFADLVALVQEQQETINDLRARVAQLEGN